MNESKLAIDLDLDSFLDILTNVIGVMILVATVIALQLQQTTTLDLGRPLLHDPPEGSLAVWVECRQGRIFNPALEENRDVAWERIHARFSQGTSWHQALNHLNSLKLGDENYSMVFEDPESGHPRIRAEFKPETTGGYYADAENKENDFRQWLTTSYDPKKHWLMVQLRRDGFESFAKCRAIAIELGFEVGWYLADDDASSIIYLDTAPQSFDSSHQVD